MFESLGNAIKQEQEKLAKKRKWIEELLEKLQGSEFLLPPFLEEQLVHSMPSSVSALTQIAGVDGGIVSESMTGFDLALYRAVGAVFEGVGNKVSATYIPHFDPDPQVFFAPSLKSRQEFNRICTLMRLYAEYEVAKLTIHNTRPTVIFIDGKITPLNSDFSIANPSKLLQQAERDVKHIYKELVSLALEKKVLLCGLVKDSRSREYTQELGLLLPKIMQTQQIDKKFIQYWPFMLEDVQDSFLSEIMISKGERTSWLKSNLPSWLDDIPKLQLLTCMAKPVANDEPVRLEALTHPEIEEYQNSLEIALGALQVLCNHGMDLAIPTVILEADERTKLSGGHLDSVIDQISLTIGVPREKLRKRRFYSGSMSRL